MQFHYRLLKGRWGIVVIIEMKELGEAFVRRTDILVTEKVFLRINQAIYLDHSLVSFWAKRAIIDLEDDPRDVLQNKVVCFEMSNFKFDVAHFQEEGLYCAVRGWIGQHYKITVSEIDVYFDNQKQKYIFPSLDNK